MAGDWIKFEKTTLTKPEILAISDKLNVDRLHAVGMCLAFWAWCDDHLTTCHARSVTVLVLDRVVGVTGFAKTLCEVGWLEDNGDSVTIPHFDRHLSQSAKTRGLNTIRQREKRSENVTNLSRSHRDSFGTREEKRREEKKETPLNPPDGGTVEKPAEKPVTAENAADPIAGNAVSGAGRPPESTKWRPEDVSPMPHGSERFRGKWCEWCEVRRKRRKPISEAAAKKQLGLLGTLTEEQAIYAIETSIANDWQGIFIPKNVGANSGGRSEFSEAERGRAIPRDKYRRPTDG